MVRKPMLRLIMLCLAALFLMPQLGSAENASSAWHSGEGETWNDAGEHFMYETENGHAVLTAYWTEPESAQQPVVTIPDTLNGLPLKEIGSGAFNRFSDRGIRFNGSSVVCLNIPEGVISLQPGALDWPYWNDSILQVRLPSTLTGFPDGGYAFEFSFPHGHPYFEVRDGFVVDLRTDSLLHCNPSASEKPLPRVKRIEADALMNYSEHQTVLAFPDSVEYIGSFNAYDCVQLEAIIVPGSVLELADHALQCNSAAEIILEEGLQRIGSWALADTGITTVTFPSTVTWIGFEPFGWWEPDEYTVLNPDAVWETEEEYNARCPEGT